MNDKPLLIGVSARIYYPRRPVLDLGGVWTKTLHYLEQSVAHWVMSPQVLAVMIPAVDSESLVKRSDLSLHGYADALDGLLLQGGNDIAPETYGETPLAPEWHGDRVRDRYELDLLDRFIKAGKPVLGICRGFQLINVAFGGTLFQDIPTQMPNAQAHLDPAHYERQLHPVEFVAGHAAGRALPRPKRFTHQFDPPPGNQGAGARTGGRGARPRWPARSDSMAGSELHVRHAVASGVHGPGPVARAAARRFPDPARLPRHGPFGAGQRHPVALLAMRVVVQVKLGASAQDRLESVQRAFYLSPRSTTGGPMRNSARQVSTMLCVVSVLLLSMLTVQASAQEVKTEALVPSAGRGAVVIVLSSRSGPAAHLPFARLLAQTGYYVVLADGQDFLVPLDSGELRGLNGAANLKRIIASVQSEPQAMPGRVAVVGFALGGSASLKHAAPIEESVSAVVAFYPNLVLLGSDIAGLAAAFKAPVLVLAGAKDRYAGKMAHDLAAAPKQAAFEMISYAASGHEFDLTTSAGYVAADAADASDKAVLFLKRLHPPAGK